MRKKRSKLAEPFSDVQVDPCPGSAGLILSVGPMSLWIDHDTARQIIGAIEAAMTRPVARDGVQRAPRNTRQSN